MVAHRRAGASLKGHDTKELVLDDTELVAFVREHVRSVWALELLVTLRREPARHWTPSALVSELRASHGLVADNLAGLQRAGVALRDDFGSYHFAPANAVVAELCARLEAAYRERPVAVINTIARPRDPLQSLADAFRFRGGGK